MFENNGGSKLLDLLHCLKNVKVCTFCDLPYFRQCSMNMCSMQYFPYFRQCSMNACSMQYLP